METVFILLCGGSGKRMRGTVADKILTEIAGTPAVVCSARAFCEAFPGGTIVCVCRDETQRRQIESLLKADRVPAKIIFTRGGNERRDSVLNGLHAAGTSVGDGIVFIHDAARPLLKAESVLRLAEAARKSGAAVLARKCVNTIKRTAVPADGGDCLLEDLDRTRLWEMETPQVFLGKSIVEAYERVVAGNFTVTDDVSAYTRVFGRPVTLVENHSPNPKITVPEDLLYLEFLLSRKNDSSSAA